MLTCASFRRCVDIDAKTVPIPGFPFANDKASEATAERLGNFSCSGVVSAILEEVLTYMNHHKGVEAPLIEKPLRSKVRV